MSYLDDRQIIERVQLLRTQHAGSRGRSKFAHELGISPSTYSYYEKDRVPPVEILLKICEVTGADLNWLLTGHSAPQKNISGLEKFAYEKIEGAEPGPKTTLLRKLDNLLGQNPELAEPISAFLELLSEKKCFEDEIHFKFTPSREGRPGWVPILGRTAAGMVHFWDQTLLPEPKQAVTELDELVKKHVGKGIINSADGKVSIDLQAKALIDGVKRRQVNLIQVSGQETGEIVEFVECEEIVKLFPDCFALRIDGDSMSPRINDGDIVILSPSVPVAQGQIGIARVRNQIGVTCKLIRSSADAIHLIPINERYETKIVAKKDLLWALAVLCHISV
jgi:transcriptional regulator with XRE-family HTH domain